MSVNQNTSTLFNQFHVFMYSPTCLLCSPLKSPVSSRCWWSPESGSSLCWCSVMSRAATTFLFYLNTTQHFLSSWFSSLCPAATSSACPCPTRHSEYSVDTFRGCTITPQTAAGLCSDSCHVDMFWLLIIEIWDQKIYSLLNSFVFLCCFGAHAVFESVTA